LDLGLDLDLDLELLWLMSAIWILPLPRVARTLVLELCLLFLKLSQLLTQALLELADKSTSLVNNKEQGQTGMCISYLN
jgi:hypothetical protein